MRSKKITRLSKECERFDIYDILEFWYKKLLNRYWNIKHIKMWHLAWIIFADYILHKKSKKGVCRCVTCWDRKKRNDPMMHPWHYRTQWSSAYYKYTEDNVYPQCWRCNVWLNGNYRNYHIFMDKEVWTERERELRTAKHLKNRKSRELAEMIREWHNYLIKHKDFLAHYNKC
jgi:hypothetical protein